jgi:hypothetical protein
MPGPFRRPASLQDVADLATSAGGDNAAFGRAIAEFLDEFYANPAKRQAMVADEPARVGRFEDAYLGAVAEHLARRWDLQIPAWVDQPHRFLDRAYFAGGLESLKAILLAESPLAFRKRQIFVEAEPLRRARMPRDEAVA